LPFNWQRKYRNSGLGLFGVTDNGKKYEYMVVARFPKLASRPDDAV